MPRADVLFWSHDWDAVVAAQRAALRAKAYELTWGDLQHRPPAALAEALAEEFSLEVPRIFPARLSVTRGVASGEPDRDFALLRAAVTRREVLHARMPFAGDPLMFSVRPLDFDRRPPPGRVGDGFLEYAIMAEGVTAEALAARIAQWPARVADWLRRQSESVGSYPEDIRRLAESALRRRTEELAAERALWADLEFVKPSTARAPAP